MVSIIDYGAGNLHSVVNALRHLHTDCRIISRGEDVKSAAALILPGVGSFGDAASELQRRGFTAPIKEYVASGRPFLGVCLGLQVLFESSEESPGQSGLSVFTGGVKRFRVSGLKVPHMGWNRLEPRPGSRLFRGIGDREYFYFVHSYHICPEDESLAAARSEYGYVFDAAVERDNAFAVQFHPEKSGRPGLHILRNFLEIAGEATC